jgi:hypothetical protein
LKEADRQTASTCRNNFPGQGWRTRGVFDTEIDEKQDPLNPIRESVWQLTANCIDDEVTTGFHEAPKGQNNEAQANGLGPKATLIT